MPSLPSFFVAASTLLPAALARYAPFPRADFSIAAGSAGCTASSQLSCHNTTAQNTCCFNAPGGSLLQTQFWDTDPATGPDNSWTIHGLWPDLCDGSYSEDCSPSRAYTNITAILQQYGKTSLLDYMNTYWVSDDSSNEEFWEHEWATHGTCISTLDPECFSDYSVGEEVPLFFQTVVDLFKTLPTYTWLADAGITPSNSKTYSVSDIQNALESQHGNPVYIDCDDGAISEVYYYFNVRGSVQNGTFVSAAVTGSSNNCDSTVKYPTK